MEKGKTHRHKFRKAGTGQSVLILMSSTHYGTILEPVPGGGLCRGAASGCRPLGRGSCSQCFRFTLSAFAHRPEEGFAKSKPALGRVCYSHCSEGCLSMNTHSLGLHPLLTHSECPLLPTIIITITIPWSATQTSPAGWFFRFHLGSLTYGGRLAFTRLGD